MKNKFLLSLLALPLFVLASCHVTPPSGGTTPNNPGNGGNGDITNPDDGGNTNPDDGGNTNPDDGGNTNPDEGGNSNPDQGGGDTGPDATMHYTYEHYVESYGYVGTEDEFYEDLGKGHVGTKKEYKISILIAEDIDFDPFKVTHFESLKTVVDNKTYKNGQKVDYDYHALETKTHLVAKIYDNYQPDLMFNTHIDSIDLDNYRAYKDCTILILYQDYHIECGTYERFPTYVKGNTYEIGLHLESYPYIHYFNNEEIKDVKITKLAGSVDFSFDTKTQMIAFPEAGNVVASFAYYDTCFTLKARVYSPEELRYAGSTFEVKFDTNKDGTSLYDHFEIGDCEQLNIYVIETDKKGSITEHREYDLDDYFEAGHIKPKFESSNPDAIRIVDGDFIYANKEGSATIKLINAYDNKVLDTIDVKAYKQGEAPKIPAKLFARRDYNEQNCFKLLLVDTQVGDNISSPDFSIEHLTITPLFTDSKVDKYYDVEICENYFYLTFYEYGYFEVSYKDALYEAPKTNIHFSNPRDGKKIINFDTRQARYLSQADIYYYPHEVGGHNARIDIDIRNDYSQDYFSVPFGAVLVLDFSKVSEVKGVVYNRQAVTGVDDVYKILMDNIELEDEMISVILE